MADNTEINSTAAGSTQADDGLAVLRPLMRAVGATVTAEAFHAAVDRAFHDAESSVYDRIHSTMWASLPQQFNLLADDLLADRAIGLPETLVVADIGCGTGRSAAALLATSLGPRITHIDLTDLSAGMLAKAADRARSWSVPHQLHPGGLDALPARAYDVILMCSVLHHLPDMGAVLAALRRRQPVGGIFLHLHDWHTSAFDDPVAVERYAHFRQLTHSRVPEQVRAWAPRAVLAGVWRRLTGKRAYIDAANDRLLAEKVIARRLTAEEFWSVTDIHVPGLPYSSGGGVSLEQVGQALGDYSLVSARTYGFFGAEHDAIPPVLRPEEQRLIGERAMNGHFIAAAWQRRSR